MPPSSCTLWCAKENVDCAGAMHFVLLGDDDGEGCASPAHVLQSLGQGHLCVEEDKVHHHAQISHLPPHHFCILPTEGQTANIKISPRTIKVI